MYLHFKSSTLHIAVTFIHYISRYSIKIIEQMSVVEYISLTHPTIRPSLVQRMLTLGSIGRTCCKIDEDCQSPRHSHPTHTAMSHKLFPNPAFRFFLRDPGITSRINETRTRESSLFDAHLSVVLHLINRELYWERRLIRSVETFQLWRHDTQLQLGTANRSSRGENKL